MAGGANRFVMTPIGDRGPPLRPGETYLSVKLLAINMPAGGFLWLSRFTPVAWATIGFNSIEGENGRKQLVGLYPSEADGAPQFTRKHLTRAYNLQLIRSLVAQPKLDLSFALASMRYKDYLKDILKVASEIAKSPATTFVSQIVPGGAAVTAGVAATVDAAATAADSVRTSIDDALEGSALRLHGRDDTTLELPRESGVFAYVAQKHAAGGLKFDQASGVLTQGGKALKAPYAVVELVCEETRHDWMALPDIAQAWTRLREARIKREGVDEAFEIFRLTALTSPDLIPADARKLADGVKTKFAIESLGAETASANGSDPGTLAEALGHYMRESMGEMESATLEAEQPWMEQGPFRRAFEVSLEHEGGYVDHPADRGGPTNKGVTQRTWHDFVRAKHADMRTASAEDVEKKYPLKDLSNDDVAEVYYQGYWRPAKCGLMPNEAIAALVFDAAINHGPRRALRMLQAAAWMPAKQCDGVWGPKTAQAVLQAGEDPIGFADDYLLARERFYRWIVNDDPTQGVFLRGWMNRLAGQRANAMALLSGAPKGLDTESGLIDGDGIDEFTHAAEADFGELLSGDKTSEVTQ